MSVARLALASRPLLATGPLSRPPVRNPTRPNPTQPLSSTPVSVSPATPSADKAKKSFVGAVSSRVLAPKTLCVLGIGGGVVVFSAAFASLTAKVGAVAASQIVAAHTAAFLAPGVVLTGFALKTTGTLAASAVLPVALPIISTVVVGTGTVIFGIYLVKKMGSALLNTTVKLVEMLPGGPAVIWVVKKGYSLFQEECQASAQQSSIELSPENIAQIREQHPTFGMDDDEIVAYGRQLQAQAREERAQALRDAVPVQSTPLIEDITEKPRTVGTTGLVVRASRKRKTPLKEQIDAELGRASTPPKSRRKITAREQVAAARQMFSQRKTAAVSRQKDE